MSFLNQLSQYPQAEVKELILTTTGEQIDNALNSPRLSVESFAHLLSPSVNDLQLEAMATRAHAITRQRFGRTILLYAPIYLSNECHNGCKYCGFSADNHLVRKTLQLKK